MSTIDLNKPIFVFYLDVRGTTHQMAQEQITKFLDNFKYDNITTWVIPIQDTSKVECIYNPNDKVKKLIDKINRIINDYNIPELKSIIREIKIENLLEED